MIAGALRLLRPGADSRARLPSRCERTAVSGSAETRGSEVAASGWAAAASAWVSAWAWAASGMDWATERPWRRGGQCGGAFEPERAGQLLRPGLQVGSDGDRLRHLASLRGRGRVGEALVERDDLGLRHRLPLAGDPAARDQHSQASDDRVDPRRQLSRERLPLAGLLLLAPRGRRTGARDPVRERLGRPKRVGVAAFVEAHARIAQDGAR